MKRRRGRKIPSVVRRELLFSFHSAAAAGAVEVAGKTANVVLGAKLVQAAVCEVALVSVRTVAVFRHLPLITKRFIIRRVKLQQILQQRPLFN